MVIDFHTHTYPEKIALKTIELLSGRSGTVAHSNGTFDDLEEKMKIRHVDMSVILPVATSAKQCEHINEIAAKENENFENTHVWSFGAIHPDNDNYKDILNDINSKGLKGIKLHPDYQDAFFNDIRYKRIISYATELGLVVVTHAGIDIGLPQVVHCTPEMAEEVLDEVQPDKLVLAHMGGWQMWDDVIERLCGRKVFMDTAFSYGQIDWKKGVSHKWSLLNKEKFTEIVEKHGADKILFGTDCPWTDQSEEIKNIKLLGFNKETENMIFSGNAKKLLSL